LIAHHTVVARSSLVDVLDGSPAVMTAGSTRVMDILASVFRRVLSSVHSVDLNIVVIAVVGLQVVSDRRPHVQIFESQFWVDLGLFPLLLAVLPFRSGS